MRWKRPQHSWWSGACLAGLLIAILVGGFSVPLVLVFIVLFAVGAALISLDDTVGETVVAEQEVQPYPQVWVEPAGLVEPAEPEPPAEDASAEDSSEDEEAPIEEAPIEEAPIEEAPQEEEASQEEEAPEHDEVPIPHVAETDEGLGDGQPPTGDDLEDDLSAASPSVRPSGDASPT